MIRKLIPVLFIVILLSGSVRALDKAPDFQIKDVNSGNEYHISDFRGSVILIDFMTLSCTGCEHLEKKLRNIWPDYNGSVDFITIDIDSETPSLTKEMIESELKSRNIPWIVGYVGIGVGNTYGIKETPTLIILDKEGYQVKKMESDVPEDDIRNALDSAIQGRLQRSEIATISIYSMAALMGLASFFSPCAFPMLPGYMAYYFGIGKEEDNRYKKAAIGGISAGMGIIVIYLTVGIFLFYLGMAALKFVPKIGIMVGILLIIFGVLMFTPIQYDRLFSPFKSIGEGKKEGSFTLKLFLYGIGYGAAAAGCTAPLFFGVVFGSIMAGSLTEGMISLVIYSGVAGGLMLLVTVGMAAAETKMIEFLKRNTERIKTGSALILIIVGAYLIWYHL